MENDLRLNKETLKLLSYLSLAAGLLAITVSLVSWFSKGSRDREHAEHLAIFFGLWVPGLFALSHRLSHAADEGAWGTEEQKGTVKEFASEFLEEVKAD
ncbi:MAG: hypothetical protein JO069_06780 [Verrucomicrobia bacterium]|nr:hypothetical protein [Verrucomicrobiota bacterium]